MTEQMKEHLIRIEKGCDNYKELPKPSEMLMMGVEHFTKKLWHKTSEGDYPVLIEQYANKGYPQIPCIVLYRGMYCIRYWNIECQCWDDEECDDFFCQKDKVERWAYIDDLLP